jgi:HEAT repeat protein
LADDRVVLPDTVLPALTNALNDLRPVVRSYATAAVGHFREAAEPVAPALLDLWTDPDELVRQSATNAFFDLPSYYILKGYWLAPIRTASLTHLLDNPDPRIREMATNAFQKLKLSVGGN